MSILDTLQPSFTPDLSRAKRVIGRASALPFKAALFNSQLPLTIRILEELVDGESTSPQMAVTLENNPKSVASTFSHLKKLQLVSIKWFRSGKGQKMAMYSINEKGKKYLETFNATHIRRESEKPLSNVSGDFSRAELESVYVEQKAEVSTSS